MNITDNLRGALLMTGAMTAFTINDAFVKSLSGELPLFQLIFLRGLAVTAFLALYAAWLGQLRRDVPRREWKLMSLRALFEVGAAFFFLYALFNMPLANVSAILQALPLTVSLGAALILGEPLGWRRMTAIAIGFVGVMLIVRPGGSDFNVYSLAALTSVLFVTGRDLVVRRIDRATPSILVALVTAVFVTVGAGLASITDTWVSLSPDAALRLAGAVVSVVFGYVLSVSAMRVGQVDVVTPFRYTSLLVALILGAVVFGDWPRGITLLGAGIVVATGLFTIYREARTRKVPPPVIPDRLR